MDDWESRMAQRAAERREADPNYDIDPEHAGHHTHLTGSGVRCSCGEYRGVVCVAWVPPIYPNLCPVCGQLGVTWLRFVRATAGSRSSADPSG